MQPAKTYLFTFYFFLVACGGKDESSSESTATVYESKGSIQCESSGLSPDDSAQVLIDVGIDVIESYCAYDNLMDIMDRCGEATNEIIVHTIPYQSIADAESVGFRNTSSIQNEYTIYACNQGT